MVIPGLDSILTVISLQGSIASGKSTFMRSMREYCDEHRLNAENPEHLDSEEKDYFLFVKEPVERWEEKIYDAKGDGTLISMLAAYYANVPEMAFRFQIFTFTTRLRELINAIWRAVVAGAGRKRRIHIISERSLRGDSLFFHMAPEKAVQGVDGIVYRELFSVCCDEYNKRESVMMYIPTPPEICVDRIIQRDRAAETESPIEKDYMLRLDSKHREMIAQFQSERGEDSVLFLDKLTKPLTEQEIMRVARETMEKIIELIK